MRTLFIAIRAAIFMSGFLVVATWLLLSIRPLDRSIGWTPPGWLVYASPFLILPGVLLVLATGGLFVFRGRGTPALFDPPRRLVAAGPFRFTRNPMYVGGLLLVAGLGLLWRSSTFLLAVPVVFVIAHLLVTLYEEPVLRAKFGADYDRYCRDVPRWPSVCSHACQLRGTEIP